MRRLSFLFLFCASLFACEVKNVSGVNECLVKSDSVIKINIPSTLSPVTYNIRCFNDEKDEYLAVENIHRHSISVFNLSNGEYLKEIMPQIEGPNGLGSRMSGFDIYSFDSIFVTIRSEQKLFVIDSSAKLIKECLFDTYYQPYMPLAGLYSNNGQVINYENGKVVVSNIWRADSDIWNESDMYSIGYQVDFINGTQFFHPLNHPVIREEKDPVLCSNKTLLVNGNNLILSYTLGHQIFVSENNKEWKSIMLKSKYISKPLQSWDSQELYMTLKLYAESPRYLAFVYDKYRNVYYRFAYSGVNVAKDDDVMKLREFIRVFSVMVIDEDFNILGETLMPENTYNSNMFFINEAGLWISTNHPDNPEFDEDMIKFQLFTLK